MNIKPLPPLPPPKDEKEAEQRRQIREHNRRRLNGGPIDPDDYPDEQQPEAKQ